MLLTANQIYRQLHLGNPGDVHFYRRALREHHRVLELGCGWGRMAIALAQDGHDVVGIDICEDFIEGARKAQSSARFIVGDITRPLPLPGGSAPFDAAIIPYNTLYSLGGSEGVAHCFENLHKQLKPGAELWFDVYPVDDLHAAREAGETIPPDDNEPVGSIVWEDTELSVFEETEFVAHAPRMHVKYSVRDSVSERGCLPMTHDYLTSEQLTALLQSCEYELVTMMESLSGDAVEEPEQLIFCAQAQ